MNGEPKPIPKSSGFSINELEDASSRIRDLERKEEAIRTEFERMERRAERSTNFMMVMIIGIAIVFLITLIPIAFDYFKYNEERFQKNTTQIQNISEDAKDKYYTKEYLDQYLELSGEILQIVGCIRSKGFVSMNCFEL